MISAFCRVPSKIIFVGEHAVVHGAAAVSAAVDFPTTANVVLSKSDEISLKVSFGGQELSFSYNLESLSPLGHLYRPEIPLSELEFSKEFLKDIKCFLGEEKNSLSEKVISLFFALVFGLGFHRIAFDCSLVVKTPIMGGMGSSASVSTALAGVLVSLLSKLNDVKMEDKEGRKVNEGNLVREILSSDRHKVTNALAFKCEKIFHGNPSGLDNVTVTNGGLILFKNGEIKNKVSGKEFEKYFAENFRILLIDSGVKRNTKKLVRMIQTFRNEMAEQSEQSEQSDQSKQSKFEEFKSEGSKTDFEKSFIVPFNEMSERLFSCFVGRKEVSKTYAEIKEIFLKCQKMLSFLGCSTVEIDEIVETCSELDFAAKITGAGGGGAVLCIGTKNSKNFDKLIQKLKEKGYKSYKADIDFKGMVFSSPELFI